jgi:hypothetical protein
VLHQVVAEHLEAFLGAMAEAGAGTGLPEFVEREFREFLLCGVYEAGVARFQCEGCARKQRLGLLRRGREELRRAAAGQPRGCPPPVSQTLLRWRRNQAGDGRDVTRRVRCGDHRVTRPDPEVLDRELSHLVHQRYPRLARRLRDLDRLALT